MNTKKKVAPARKPAPKKAVASKKKVAVKKTALKRVAAPKKKVAVKKPTAKQSVAPKKKVVAKKQLKTKPLPKKLVPKKKIVIKKTAAKKPVPKKAAVTKKPVPKKVPVKKVTVIRPAPQKTAPKALMPQEATAPKTVINSKPDTGAPHSVSTEWIGTSAMKSMHCPDCGAIAGELCVSKETGKKIWESHPARIVAYTTSRLTSRLSPAARQQQVIGGQAIAPLTQEN